MAFPTRTKNFWQNELGPKTKFEIQQVSKNLLILNKRGLESVGTLWIETVNTATSSFAQIENIKAFLFLIYSSFKALLIWHYLLLYHRQAWPCHEQCKNQFVEKPKDRKRRFFLGYGTLCWYLAHQRDVLVFHLSSSVCFDLDGYTPETKQHQK